MSAGLALSVVVVARDGFAPIRRTVAAVRAQSIADRIELLIVAAPGAMDDHRPAELAGFARVEVIDVPSFHDVDRASAAGLLAARAPVVASLEDHVMPEPGWAEEAVRGHAEGWAAFGGRMVNGNPRSLLSWANVLASHLPEIAPRHGEAQTLSSHNAIYDTAVVQAYGEGLAARLGRTGGLMRDLRRGGHRLGVHMPCRFRHWQITRLAPLWSYRVATGRSFADTRARREGWSRPRRLAYAAASPLVPAIQTLRIARRARAMGLPARVLPLVGLVVTVSAWGEALGYARGDGGAQRLLCDLEVRRDRHMSRADRRDWEREVATT